MTSWANNLLPSSELDSTEAFEKTVVVSGALPVADVRKVAVVSSLVIGLVIELGASDAVGVAGAGVARTLLVVLFDALGGNVRTVISSAGNKLADKFVRAAAGTLVGRFLGRLLWDLVERAVLGKERGGRRDPQLQLDLSLRLLK